VLAGALLLLAGCVVHTRPVVAQPEMHQPQIDFLFSQWGEEDQRQNEALGERVYDKDFDLVFSAIVTGFSDIGFSVRNMERQSGYILAHGPSPIPDPEYRSLVQASCDEINKVATRTWHPNPGRAAKSVTITLVRLDANKVKVKMRIAAGRFQDYPPLMRAEYQRLWQALERQIFLDENLDRVKK